MTHELDFSGPQESGGSMAITVGHRLTLVGAQKQEARRHLLSPPALRGASTGEGFYELVCVYGHIGETDITDFHIAPDGLGWCVP